MAKNTTIFFCRECGYESAKWLGQCPGCKTWNSFVEEKTADVKGRQTPRGTHAAPSRLSEVSAKDDERISTGFSELDRVLGGGIVPGALVLAGGDPGIGKSTLLLQVCDRLSAQGKKILYVSGEESLKQIKLRASRLNAAGENMLLLCETDLDAVLEVTEKEKPELVVIDSIQTMYSKEAGSSPGSVTQIRESTNALMRTAKTLAIPIFVVGHVTKEGVVAGPKILEHMVDTVLYFEGDRYSSYRLIRTVKNRFGSTNEVGVFEMKDNGLSEVKNPSEYMLEGRPLDASGSVVSCSMEGTRPILVEVQALLSKSAFGMARRTAAGIDHNRVNLLMAVLEKRAGIKMSEYDAYVNVAGGMRVNEPSFDLALCLALASSFKNAPVNPETIVFGEVGLSGEVRTVSAAAARVNEAKKLGFKECVVPAASLSSLRGCGGIQITGVKNVKEAIDRLL